MVILIGVNKHEGGLEVRRPWIRPKLGCLTPSKNSMVSGKEEEREERGGREGRRKEEGGRRKRRNFKKAYTINENSQLRY